MSKRYLSVIIFIIIALAVAVAITLVMQSSDDDYSPQTSAGLETTNSNGTTTASKTYTLADVATHNSPSNCWAAVNGGVYDFTSWISKHPGGEKAIIGLCGKDGSNAFNNQHGGQDDPAKALASFKIGTLAK